VTRPPCQSHAARVNSPPDVSCPSGLESSSALAVFRRGVSGTMVPPSCASLTSALFSAGHECGRVFHD
jgi:hypothetical protein